MLNIAKKTQERVRIGPYQVIAKIGEGGMGTVFLTKLDGPPGFNKLAVVKELRADLTGTRHLVEMFLNEVRLAARLTHPNVVHTYGASEEDGALHLAMEYLDGQPWSRIRHALWQAGSLPFGLHIKVLAEVLAGLHYAHELRDYDGSALRVVHCDVSPQNVFVTYDGQVKIVDFGVACAVTDERRSGAKMLVGKLAYIAPEQARGEDLDRRADVFAVGVMLWELMAGKRFAEGDDFTSMRERRAEGREPRIRELMPEAPAKLAEICDRALAFDPKDRFATAGEFREALLNYLSEDMQDIDHVQLGELVVETFREDRARLHAMIERHLSSSPPPPRQSSIENLIATLGPEPGEYTLKADLSELASVSRIRDDAALVSASNSASIRVERRLPRAPVWAGIAACVLLLGSWLWGGSDEPAPAHQKVLPLAAATQPAPAATTHSSVTALAAPPAVARSRPTTFQLSVTATPAEATFLLDGVPLRGNPYSVRRQTDNDLHLLRAVGPGLQSQERVIAFDRDRSVAFKLARLPVVAVRTVVRAVRRAAPESVASVISPAAAGAAAASPARSKGEPAYDAALVPSTGARKIYDEDPYR